MIITVSLVNVLPNILTEFFSCIDNFEGLLSWQPGFSGGRVVKNLPANAGDARVAGSVLKSGRSLGVGNGNPLQYTCLENPMDSGAWRATAHGVTKSWKPLKQLSTHMQEEVKAGVTYSFLNIIDLNNHLQRGEINE